MIRLAIAAVLVGASLVTAPAATGSGCEPRSSKHVLEHGGLAADSAWHVARGELPTCSSEASSSRSSSDRDYRRDRFGWNCSWRGCG